MARDLKTPLVLDPEACTHCRECLDACAPGAIELTDDDVYIDPSVCDGCEDCALVCPTTAIQVAGCESDVRPVARRELAQPANVIPLESARSLGSAAAPWQMTDVAFGLVLLLALSVFQRTLRLPLRLQGLSSDVTHLLLTLWMVVFYAVVVGGLLFMAKRRGAVLEDLGVRKFELLKALGYSLGALAVVRVLTVVYGVITTVAGFPGPAKIEVQMLRWFGFGPMGFALAILIAVIIAPIAEELFFRGFVYGALRDRVGVLGAIVASSLIFALYHANLWLIIPVMFLGMALAWLFETQNSLGPPLLFHGLYNFLAIIQIYFLSGK